MTTWRCSVCRAATYGAITNSLDPRYSMGYCTACRKRQTFVLHAEPAEGEALKEEGMAIAEAHDPDWKQAAREVARLLAASGREFTQDDITDAVGLPRSRNATGSLLSGLARSGAIVRVGDTKGKRDSQHARRISVWRGSWASS